MVSKTPKNTKTSNKRSVKKTSPIPQALSLNAPAPAKPSELSPVVIAGMTAQEQKKIQEMLMHAQLEFAKIKTLVVKEKKREIETLDLIIKEFMGPFMLIGYDLNNNPVEMVSAASPGEHDALLERLRRVMYKISQNIANSNGSDPYGYNNN